MISLRRSLVRQLRTVFQKAAARSDRGRLRVTLSSGRDGLRVRLHQSNILVEFHEAGRLPAERLAMPFESFASCSSRREGMVGFEAAGNRIRTRWQDKGVPQSVEVEAAPLDGLPPFPAVPTSMSPVASALVTALADASLVVAKAGTRYALEHVQLRGRDGKVVATDGRHLLVQDGHRFPWKTDVLVPASAAFGCLTEEKAVFIGRNESHVCLQAGAWMFHLLINREGRYPDTDAVIPVAGKVTSRAHLAAADRQQLARALPRLPGARDDDSPVAIELDGTMTVRAQTDGEDKEVAVCMGDSAASGKKVRVSLNRRYLALALKLGFAEFHVVAADVPVLFRDEKRLYVVMPLFRDISTATPAASPSPSPPRISVPVSCIPASRCAAVPNTLRPPASMSVGCKPLPPAPVAAAKQPKPLGHALRPVRFFRSAVKTALRFSRRLFGFNVPKPGAPKVSKPAPAQSQSSGGK